MSQNGNENNVLRIEWTRSGDIRDADHHGLGYGLVFTHDLIEEIEAGRTVINAETGEQVTADYVRKILY